VVISPPHVVRCTPFFFGSFTAAGPGSFAARFANTLFLVVTSVSPSTWTIPIVSFGPSVLPLPSNPYPPVNPSKQRSPTLALSWLARFTSYTVQTLFRTPRELSHGPALRSSLEFCGSRRHAHDANETSHWPSNVLLLGALHVLAELVVFGARVVNSRANGPLSQPPPPGSVYVLSHGVLNPKKRYVRIDGQPFK